MTDCWNLQTFSTIMEKSGWKEAIKYKNSYIPSKLFKYYPLFDEKFYAFRKKNQERLECLDQGNFWLSDVDSLNDPFEFRALFLNKENIERLGWNLVDIDAFINKIRHMFYLSCFSDNVESNLPLWAHYSNNHKGYCIEYSILIKDEFFPVSYYPIRESTTTIVTKVFSEFLKGYYSEQELSSKFWHYLRYLFLSFSLKFSYWSYEKEYRLFYPDISNGIGQLISLPDAKLAIDKIYIGIHCEYKDHLVKIAKNLNCELYEMMIDFYCSDFTLIPMRIM